MSTKTKSILADLFKLSGWIRFSNEVNAYSLAGVLDLHHKANKLPLDVLRQLDYWLGYKQIKSSCPLAISVLKKFARTIDLEPALLAPRQTTRLKNYLWETYITRQGEIAITSWPYGIADYIGQAIRMVILQQLSQHKLQNLNFGQVVDAAEKISISTTNGNESVDENVRQILDGVRSHSALRQALTTLTTQFVANNQACWTDVLLSLRSKLGHKPNFLSVHTTIDAALSPKVANALWDHCHIHNLGVLADYSREDFSTIRQIKDSALNEIILVMRELRATQELQEMVNARLRRLNINQ